ARGEAGRRRLRAVPRARHPRRPRDRLDRGRRSGQGDGDRRHAGRVLHADTVAHRAGRHEAGRRRAAQARARGRRTARLTAYMGGPDMAPHTPQPPERPGEPVALLDHTACLAWGPPHGPPYPPPPRPPPAAPAGPPDAPRPRRPPSLGAPTRPPIPPNARSAPGNPWRSSITPPA